MWLIGAIKVGDIIATSISAQPAVIEDGGFIANSIRNETSEAPESVTGQWANVMMFPGLTRSIVHVNALMNRMGILIRARSDGLIVIVVPGGRR